MYGDLVAKYDMSIQYYAGPTRSILHRTMSSSESKEIPCVEMDAGTCQQ